MPARAGGRLDDAELAACIARIGAVCQSVTWPPGCAPTAAEADACVEMLRRADLVEVATDELHARDDALRGVRLSANRARCATERAVRLSALCD